MELPSILHGEAARQEGRPRTVSFEIKQEETELMLEGGVLDSLIGAIKNVGQ